MEFNTKSIPLYRILYGKYYVLYQTQCLPDSFPTIELPVFC
jgi:hypothetical protein